MSANNLRGDLPRSLTRLPMWLVLTACGTGPRVSYVDGKCVIDGLAAPLAQVQARQAQITQHVLSRQPILTAIAVAAVVIAGAGYLQRILTVLAARRAHDQTFGDRLRKRMERYRTHPVRYFMLLGLVLGLLVAAGVAYVGMDADKRTSERALANLQFCHLALRSAEEQHVLAEQRDNLASISSSEGQIRALVDGLPPAEQQKAHEIVQQLSASLGQQRTMVAHLAEHADVAAKAVSEHQAVVERGLSKLADDVVDLKSMPAAIGKLSGALDAVTTHQDTLGSELEACTARMDTMAKSVDGVGKQLDELANRPAPACPACTCGAAVAVSAPATVTAAHAVAPATHASPLAAHGSAPAAHTAAHAAAAAAHAIAPSASPPAAVAAPADAGP
ncbi:MAG: hypothetical protein ABI467_28540 [Kofleriaceae bacterium]